MSYREIAEKMAADVSANQGAIHVMLVQRYGARLTWRSYLIIAHQALNILEEKAK